MSGIQTSVLRPVAVTNTGKIVLVVVPNVAPAFKIAPGEAIKLEPGDYRIQVDFSDPPIVVVIATITYNNELKKFDIQALDGVKEASFVTSVDLMPV